MPNIIEKMPFADYGTNFRDTGSGMYQVELPAGGGVIPLRGIPDSESAQIAGHDAIGAVMRLAKAATDVANDKNLSDDGRNNKLAPLMTEAETMLASVAQRVAKMTDVATENEQQFYAPPLIEKDNAVEFLADSEIRRYVLQLEAGPRTDFLRDMANGTQSRALLALKRSPVPLPPDIRDFVDRAWIDSRRNATSTYQVGSLIRAREDAEWSAHALRSAQDAFGRIRARALTQPGGAQMKRAEWERLPPAQQSKHFAEGGSLVD